MKKNLFLVEFIFIFLNFIFPAILNNGTSQEVIKLHFNISTVLLFITAFILIYQHKKEFYPYKTENEHKEIKVTKFIKTLLVTISLLIITAFIISKIFNIQNKEIFSMPSNFFEWINLIAEIIIAAFYEESVYRLYLPEAFYNLAKMINIKESKSLKICIELAAILLFALGHRYLGLPAVINAIICGIILRYSCISQNIFASATSHIIYNLLAFLL